MRRLRIRPWKAWLPAFRNLALFEAGAAILFFGALAQQTELRQTATTAMSELAAQGYKVPSEDDPLRVFPALTTGDFSGGHAGGWRPGSVYLRSQPQGNFGASVYLRHELFHEVSHRSCAGHLPDWAEEMAAMRFSGELTGQEPGPWPNESELQGLKTHIRQGITLDVKDRELLGRLAVNADWPNQPCLAPAKLSGLLGLAFNQTGGGYLLISLQSGRILESGGDINSRLPPGSLLKIPYAAALSQANPELLSAELVASDTDKLLRRREHFQVERYRLLLSPIKQQTLPAQVPRDEQDWRAYLGERSSNGDFALQASLPELALAMRAALLSRPDYFRGLSQNGTAPNSTLAGQSQADKRVLLELQAMSKTGTISTGDGQPLAGHLLAAWPASHPVFLAIFRQLGVNGAALAPKAATLLRSWRQGFPARYASVRVHLLSATDPSSWEADSDCPELSIDHGRLSVCGAFKIISTARGSRSERRVYGVLHRSPDNATVLETDTDSYADAVIAAEAQHLSGTAKQAMRAVIAWNGSRGGHRHAASKSLCDTTHCMVFLGESPDSKPHGGRTDIELLQFLDKLAADKNWNWLPFANGGDQRWLRQIGADQLHQAFAEKQILEIRRERRKDGDIFIRLSYPDGEEAISCEVFRNTLKLPSCPDKLQTEDNQSWQFQGIGTGHGLGLSIVRAQALAESGHSAEQILRDAFEQNR